MRSLRSLKSTHWVMWSSPLLLLVLVFTLTTSTPSRATNDTALFTTTTTSGTTSPTAVITTTTTTVQHRVAAPRRRTNPKATATKPSHGHAVTSATTRLTAPTATTIHGQRGAGSSSVTASSASSIASASAENAGSGALSGQLRAHFDVAVIPLEGPGTWTVAASAPIGVTLNCQDAVIHVQTQFVIGAHEECQVTISPTTTTTSLTWQLLPTN